MVPALVAVIGYLLIGFAGLPILAVLILGVAAILAVVRFAGKSTKPEDLIKEENCGH